MDPHAPYQSPPIVPGAPQPAPTLSTLMPTPPAPPRRRLGWLLWAAPAVIALGVAATLVGPQLMGTVTAAPRAPLAAARETCGRVGGLGDGDKTLVLDMEGKKSGSGYMTVDQVTCVLRVLDVPAYVMAEMEKTRALDGRQSQSWGDFEASWTYHPDEGLDVIIRQVK